MAQSTTFNKPKNSWQGSTLLKRSNGNSKGKETIFHLWYFYHNSRSMRSIEFSKTLNLFTSPIILPTTSTALSLLLVLGILSTTTLSIQMTILGPHLPITIAPSSLEGHLPTLTIASKPIPSPTTHSGSILVRSTQTQRPTSTFPHKVLAVPCNLSMHTAQAEHLNKSD